MGKIDKCLTECGAFKVMAFPKSDAGQPNQSLTPVIGAYADDTGRDIILRLADENGIGELSGVVLQELFVTLQMLNTGRDDYEVEFSASGPGEEWRLDLPIVGTGVNPARKLFAFITAG